MLNGTSSTEGDVTRSKLYMDLGGELDLADSMRSFNAAPSTTTPNDQTGFAEFCYGAVGTCARGGELFCVPGAVADGGLLVDTKPYETSGQDLVQDLRVQSG